MTRPTLIVFARAPALGVGKRRLAADVGDVEALRLYRAISSDLLRRLGRDPRWRTVVRIAPDRGRLTDRACEPQGPGDLGARLQRALRRHARGPVAVIGTDAPDVTPERVWRAFRATRGPGAAIGPADDGGFWILALSGPRARRVAFPGVRWSSARTLEDTLAAIGGEAVRLDVLIDVDDGDSLRAWRRSRPASRR